MTNGITVGISSCLLGNEVRYNGQHKLDHYLADLLGQFVQWIPVCPEMECGLHVPRESMHLQGNLSQPHMVTTNSGIDHTDRMKNWIAIALPELEKQDLCGFVFKTRSPSCGMRGIKVYKEKGKPIGSRAGLFADAFIETFPLLPIEDEGRLNDAGLRENFIERLFIVHRWKTMQKSGMQYKDLIDFHARHKYTLMAHSPKYLKQLGVMVASGKKRKLDLLMQEYFAMLMEALTLKATISKNTNVLLHIMGYFKNQLSSDEKQELREVIDDYHQELVPLIVPVVLIQHYVRKYDQPYLKEQYYIYPHPKELKLRNHV